MKQTEWENFRAFNSLKTSLSSYYYWQSQGQCESRHIPTALPTLEFTLELHNTKQQIETWSLIDCLLYLIVAIYITLTNSEADHFGVFTDYF